MERKEVVVVLLSFGCLIGELIAVHLVIHSAGEKAVGTLALCGFVSKSGFVSLHFEVAVDDYVSKAACIDLVRNGLCYRLELYAERLDIGTDGGIGKEVNDALQEVAERLGSDAVSLRFRAKADMRLVIREMSIMGGQYYK